jgi:tetratricopeptide (TPR) repeat protein
VSEQFDEGARIARAALKANPGEFLLTNNRAFCLLKLDRVAEGADLLDSIDPETLDRENATIFLATLGLLHFRSGRRESGRDLYAQAIRRAPSVSHEQRAKINLAVEEYRAGLWEDALSLTRELLAANQASDDPEIRAWLKRLPRPE